MTQSTISGGVCYLLSDLCDERHALGRKGDLVLTVEPIADGRWRIYPDDRTWDACWITADPTVQQVRDWAYGQGYLSRRSDRYTSPERTQDSADHFAALCKAATDAQALLGLPLTREMCLAVARQRRTFSQELCALAPKKEVQKAVAVLRAELDVQEAQAAAVRAAQEAERARQAALDAPIIEAVTAAYEECGYRTCTQGHTLSVAVREKAALSSGTEKGDQYSSRCTFRRIESVHTITVARDWLETVQKRDLATWDGKLCLSVRAGKDFTLDGHPVLMLTLVRQGRGTSLESETVYLVEAGEGEYEAVPSKQVISTRKHLAQKAGLDLYTTPTWALADKLDDMGLEADAALARTLEPCTY